MSEFGLLDTWQQLKKKPCPRCTLLFDPTEEEACPHCGDLDDNGLRRLQERIEEEREARRQMGPWFFRAAAVTLFLMVLVALV